MAVAGGSACRTLLSCNADRQSWRLDGLGTGRPLRQSSLCLPHGRKATLRHLVRVTNESPFSSLRNAPESFAGPPDAIARSPTRWGRKIASSQDGPLRQRGAGRAKTSVGATSGAGAARLPSIELEVLEPSIWKKVIAEFLGVFTLVTIGCGCVAVDALTKGGLPLQAIALTWGATVMALSYAVGHISGGHFNPAVTIALGLFDKFPKKHIPHYVLAQCAASILASKVLELTLGTIAHVGVTLPKATLPQALIMEFIATAFLLFTVAAVATDKRAEKPLSGVAVGGVIFATALFAGPISGASLNPARTLGPAIIAGQYAGLWVYVVGPVLGALVGLFAYEAVR